MGIVTVKTMITILVTMKRPMPDWPMVTEMASNSDDDGNIHYGYTVVSSCTYMVDVDGKIHLDEVIMPLENAIFDDLSEHVESNKDHSSFTDTISAKLEDYVAVEFVRDMEDMC